MTPFKAVDNLSYVILGDGFVVRLLRREGDFGLRKETLWTIILKNLTIYFLPPTCTCTTSVCFKFMSKSNILPSKHEWLKIFLIRQETLLVHHSSINKLWANAFFLELVREE